MIRYEDKSAATNPDIVTAFSTASCDGTNIYVVNVQSEKAAKKVLGDQFEIVRHDLPYAIVKVYPGVYPTPKEQQLQFLWFGVASHCVFQGGDGSAKPPFIVDDAIFGSDAYFCRYEWLNEASSGERRLVLKSDGREWIRNRPSGKIDVVRLLPPFDKGYILGEAIWRSTTNLLGIPVFGEYEFTAFLPKQASNTRVHENVSFSTRCKIHKIFKSKTSAVTTELQGVKVLVEDRRFAREGHPLVTYTSTNFWSPKVGSELKQILQSKPQETVEQEVLRQLGVQARSKRPVVLILITASTFLAAGWLIYGNVRTSKLQNKKGTINNESE